MPPFYTANKLDADSSAASIMDLQTVWNRMDQLERLVLTQSKEIDNLKRIVNPARSYDSRLYNHHHQQQQQNEYYPSQQQPPDQYRKNYSNERFISSSNSGHRNMSSKFIPNNGQLAHNGYKSSDKPYHRQTFQPYLMNSFVHPPNAIPPGANRRQLIDDDDNHHHHHPNHKSNGFERNNRTPPLPVSKRWSAAPNLASNMDAADRSVGNLGESLDDSDELQNHKHGRQTFVEPSSNGSSENPDPPPPPNKDGVEDRIPQPMVLSDDEEVDVERLDSSGASEQIIVHELDGASSALVLAAETTLSDHAITNNSDYDSDVQEIAVIPPKPKSKQLSETQKSSNQLAIYQPGASETNNNSNSSSNSNNNNNSNHNKSFSGSENRRVRIKTVPKRNMRRHSSDPKSADQSWIWSKDPNSSSKSSLPPELAQVIKKSPF